MAPVEEPGLPEGPIPNDIQRRVKARKTRLVVNDKLVSAAADSHAHTSQKADVLNFHKVLRSGDFAAVEAILTEAGKDWMINAIDQHSRTALHLAAFDGNERIVRMLIRRGARLGVTAMDGMTPLHFAAQRGNQSTVETLLTKGAKVDAVLSRGSRTALHLACKNKHYAVAVVLLEFGANLQAKTAQGECVLDWTPKDVGDLLRESAAQALEKMPDAIRKRSRVSKSSQDSHSSPQVDRDESDRNEAGVQLPPADSPTTQEVDISNRSESHKPKKPKVIITAAQEEEECNS